MLVNILILIIKFGIFKYLYLIVGFIIEKN